MIATARLILRLLLVQVIIVPDIGHQPAEVTKLSIKMER